MNAAPSSNLQRVLASDALNPRFRSHLRLVEPDDAAFICELRSDPALNKHLSASSPDVEAQRAWILRYKEREASGSEFYFVIRCDGNDVGVVRLYDFKEIDGKPSFCWGSWIIKPPRPPGLVNFSAAMIYELGFDALGFERSHFDVRNENTGVIAFHTRAGATLEEVLEHDHIFSFWRKDWEAFRKAVQPQITAHRVPAH